MSQVFDYKVFATLFFAIFAAVLGMGIVVPLLPVYAHELGAKGIYIGLIFGAFALSRSVCLPYFGRLSDRKGRKGFIVAGLGAYALISLFFLFAADVTTLIGIRFVQGIASAMIMPVVQAYVGDITPPGREGFIMGLFNMSMFFGLSLGPLMGGVIKDQLSLDAAFVCLGLLALFGFLLAWAFLPPIHTERVVQHRHPVAPWGHLLRDRVTLALVGFRLAYTAAIGVIWCFLPILADSRLGLDSTAIGFLVMLGVFISGCLNTPMGWLSDRWNRKVLVIIGGLLVSGSLVRYATARDFEGLIWGGLLFGTGGGIAMPALMAIAVEKGRTTHSMGTVMAILTVAHSAGMLAGSLLGGLMMDWYHLELAFHLGAAVVTVGVVLFMGLLIGRGPRMETAGAPLPSEPPPAEEGPPIG
ncbi:MAG: MFS transporter [Desulfosarcinaceae bacterium]|nr:MFS transporter [Desulfosarcinaceae bacterium]